MTAAARKLVMTMVVAVALVAPCAAHGAQYTVHACGDAAHNENHLFVGTVSDARMAARTLCTADAAGHAFGVGVLAGVSQGVVPVFANATQSFLAPPGTTISRVHVKADAHTSNGDWAALLQASNDRFSSTFWTVAGCATRPGDASGCTAATPQVEQNHDTPGATGLRAVAACGNFAGCGTFTTSSWPFSRAYYLMQQVDLTLEDTSVPAVTVIGGGLADSGWLRGSQRVVYEASDNSGVLRSNLVVDDTVFEHFERPCDYTFAVPCGNLNDATFSLDTTRIGDGPHRISVAAFDATDANRGVASRTVLIDNHAPAEPASPSVVGGEGWHTTDDFTIQWANPGSAAPITRALYEVCRTDGSGCVSGEQAASGISQLSGVHVGQPGDYTIRVWLADAAGNVSDAKSAPLHLKFDNVPPAQAQPQHRNGWVNQNDAEQVNQQINLNGSPPVSGIAGYAVTTDGSDPGTVVNVPAKAGDGYVGHTVFNDLREGTTTVRARAISGAGIPSVEVGSADIHVDRTAPLIAVDGAPDEHHWSRTAVVAHVTATDPGELSGMASGADASGTFGGYVAFGLGQADQMKRWGPPAERGSDGRLAHIAGASAEAVIHEDGMHRLTFTGSDVAGNVTPTQSVGFKIDRTAPELAVFEAQRASDPRLIEVAASDRMSGLADGGEVRLRRIAPTQGPWITLTTARQGSRYYGHVENATLVDGEYEFVATIPDEAGNQAIATADRDGRPKVLHISPTQVGPYPAPVGAGQLPNSEGSNGQDAKATKETRLTAAAVERTVVRKKCTRGSGARRKRCPRGVVRELLVHDLRVGFGKTALVRGALRTSAGESIPGAEITVLARPAMAGGYYRAVAAITTGGGGRFVYRVPAGSSRTLDFHFRGDSKYKHSDEQVTLRIPAAATIKASRHNVRNGGSVTFAGRLRGRPYPVRGKVLDLQAFYRHSWRTFATPRAAKNGRWIYKYRFGATRGSVLYKFRVRARATSDYPYELGYSKTTNVRVHG